MSDLITMTKIDAIYSTVQECNATKLMYILQPGT